MSELTETMKSGLLRMAKKLERQEASLGEPNNNTAKALVKRGLVQGVGKRNGWDYYILTEDGKKTVSKLT